MKYKISLKENEHTENIRRHLINCNVVMDESYEKIRRICFLLVVSYVGTKSKLSADTITHIIQELGVGKEAYNVEVVCDTDSFS